MTELIGKFAPIAAADIDDDPRCIWRFVMKPYGRRPRGMILDANVAGLTIRNQLNTRKANLPHALHDLKRRRRKRPAPIALDSDVC